ncbi:MAG TPA: MFS transporter [Gaiellaceae bacterium]|jgi:putative MFS transporter|nr:MFS transporter [Gaiellaceae bacterium]
MAVVEVPIAVERAGVEGVLRRGGFTSFHRRAVLVTGIAWTFVAMEILLVGFTLPVFGAEWSLSSTWLGWIGASALAGSLVGSLVLGRAADRIGRKRIFQYSILWYAAFTALTALAWGPAAVFGFRFLAGIGLGGMLVVDPSLLAEYLPPQRRGRFLAFLDFFWPFGLLIATGLSWVFLDQLGGEWRWLFVAAAFPALFAWVVRRTLPESPYYLARVGRRQEAAEVLEEITGEPVDAATIEPVTESRSSVRDLVSERLRSTTTIVVLVWIALNISYYGLFLWLPGVLGAEGKYDLNVYVLLVLVALAQFPGYAAAIWLVEAWGRKPTLATFLALGGASALTFALADSTPVYVGALFFVGFFNLGAWGAVYPYTSELFPTRLRSSGFGLAEGFGKGAAIGGPYLFGYLIDATGSTTWSLAFVAAVMVFGAAVALLGRETRGARLA